MLSDGEPVFNNVTADWRINCLVNHEASLNREAVKDKFDVLGVEYLVGDLTNNHPEIRAFLTENSRSGVPLYFLVFGMLGGAASTSRKS